MDLCYLPAILMQIELLFFGFMVQDILKRMVLFCKAAVEVHHLTSLRRVKLANALFLFIC